MARCGIPKRRAGFASLELVLFLPFLVVLLAMIFTIGGAAVTRGNVAVQARNDAWQTTVDQPARQLEWWGSTPATGTPIVTANPDASRGTVSKTTSAPIKAYAGRALGVGQVAAAEHHVIHGSWDSTAIRIEASSPLLPSRQLKDFIANELDFLTNFNNLKYLLSNIKVGGGDLSIGDLIDAVQTIKDLKDNLSDFGDAVEFPPNIPKMGRLFPDIVKNTGELAVIAGKLSKQMGGSDMQPTPTPSFNALKIIKALKDIPDAVSKLGDSLSGIGNIIDRLTKSNDY